MGLHVYIYIHNYVHSKSSLSIFSSQKDYIHKYLKQPRRPGLPIG